MYDWWITQSEESENFCTYTNQSEAKPKIILLFNFIFSFFALFILSTNEIDVRAIFN